MIAAIGSLCPSELLLFARGHVFDHAVGDFQSPNHIVVDNPHPAGGDRTHRQLLAAWHAQLANDKDIQRRIERPRHLEGHRHAAPGQSEHRDIWAAGVSHQPPRQPSTRISAVSESSQHHFLRNDSD